jgi:hypothetical protein
VEPIHPEPDAVLTVFERPKREPNIRDATGMLLHADEAYVAHRFLSLCPGLGLTSVCLYLACQAAEKYLKAFLIAAQGQLRVGKGGQMHHRLDQLCQECAPHDPFFDDVGLREVMRRLSLFDEVGRYPQSRLESWALVTPMAFLDEFAYKVRQLVCTRVDKAQSINSPVSMLQDEQWVAGHGGWALVLRAALLAENEYFS